MKADTGRARELARAFLECTRPLNSDEENEAYCLFDQLANEVDRMRDEVERMWKPALNSAKDLCAERSAYQSRRRAATSDFKLWGGEAVNKAKKMEKGSLSKIMESLAEQGCKPSVIYRGRVRGQPVWRAHVNAGGNRWEESWTPYLAMLNAAIRWEAHGCPNE